MSMLPGPLKACAIRTALGCFLVGISQTAVVAKEARPAPQYFLDLVMATTTAQNLALACPSLSFEILRAAQASGAVMSKLAEDGFDSDKLDVEMIDPSEDFAQMQHAFMVRYDLLDQPETDAVCAAGHAEIEAKTAIGEYLTSVSP